MARGDALANAGLRSHCLGEQLRRINERLSDTREGLAMKSMLLGVAAASALFLAANQAYSDCGWGGRDKQ